MESYVEKKKASSDRYPEKALSLSRFPRLCDFSPNFKFEDNLVRIHLIAEMIHWTVLAPQVFEHPISGSLQPTGLALLSTKCFSRKVSPETIIPSGLQAAEQGKVVFSKDMAYYLDTPGGGFNEVQSFSCVRSKNYRSRLEKCVS